MLRSRIVHIRRIAPPAAAVSGIDGVLISHAHLDHLDLSTLRGLPDGVQVVAPAGAARVLRRRTGREIVEVTAGDRVEVGALGVEVVPAAHDGRRVPVGHATPAVGYVVAADSARIGFFGDTDVFDGMRDLSIDLALLPIWGWGSRVGPGHLDPERAARAVALLEPRIVVPIHWGTFASPRVWWRADPAMPARAFAEAVAEQAPDVDVRVLAPGERLPLVSP